MKLDQTIEAVLFAAARPFTVKKLATLLEVPTKEAEEALTVLAERLVASGSGVMLQRNAGEAEIVTRPEAADAVKTVVTEEAKGELTRAALEALTILAYRGPMTRPELEQIRGINSAIILRNLMMRGLVESKEGGPLGQPTYAVTFEFLNHLGLSGVSELPEYDALHGHETIAQVLSDLDEAKPSEEEKPSVEGEETTLSV